MPQTYLAEITEVLPASHAGACLSLFFQTGENPAACVTDPVVVGEQSALGHWQLLGVDDERRRAYYARVEHGAGFDCDGRIGRAE